MNALRSYRLLTIWQLRRMRRFLPLGIVVQGLLALGIVAGYPLLFPSIDRTTMLYLATGGPAVSLITMGLVAVPQLVSQARTEGTLAYMRSLPIPRWTYLLADMTVWLIVVLPGVGFSVLVASLRFGLELQVSPLVVPGIALIAATATCVGYATASLLPQMLANMASQVMVVFVLMFSPLTFPADHLPSWLAGVHHVLPIEAMGEVLRGTLAGGSFPITSGAFGLLGAWCLACFAITNVVLARRG
jgi:ABC-2 type transport system permease protein